MGNQVDLTLRIGSEFSGLLTAKSELDKFFAQFKAGFNLNLGAKLSDFITGIPARAISSVREYAQQTEQIVSSSERARGQIGLTSEYYQVLANTLTSANQQASDLEPAISTLSRTIGEAANGSDVAQQKLAGVGLAFRDLKGLAPERQLELVAQQLARITDANQRDAAAAELLGKSYKSLKPLLEALARDGLDALRASIEKTTGIISNDLSKSIDDASTRSENAGKRIAAALAPAVSEWKKMLAYAKEYAANLIDGKSSAPVPLTREQVAAQAARSSAAGLTPAEIQQLIDAELKQYAFARDNSFRIESLTGLTSEQYISAISARVTALEDELAKARQASDAEAEFRSQANPATTKRETELNRSTIEGLRRKMELETQIAQSKREQAAFAAKGDEERRTLAFVTEQKNLSRELADYELTIARIESNRFLTQEQKANALRPLIVTENKLLADRIRLLLQQLEITENLTPAERQQIQDRIDQLNHELAGNETKLTSNTQLGFTDQLRADITKLRDTWGTTSQQISGFITNTVGTAVDSVSDGIYGLITKTKTWGQVGLQAGAQVLQSLIKTGVQIGVNSALGVGAQKTQQVTAATTGPSIAASYAPASAAVNTATYGSSAVVGAAAAAAAIGLIIGLLAKNAFAGGGSVIGPGSGTSDSILARLSNGEFVMRSAAVSSLGVSRMAYINRTGRLPGYAEGGMVNLPSLSQAAGSAPTAQALPPIYFYTDYRAAVRDSIARGHYDAEIIDALRRNSFRTG